MGLKGLTWSGLSGHNMISTNEGTLVRQIGSVKHFISYDKVNVILKTSGALARNLLCEDYETPMDLSVDYTTLFLDHKQFVDSRIVAISDKIHKRSLLGFLVGPLISVIGVGLTEYQIHKINQHLGETNEQVLKVFSRLDKLASSQIIFEKKTIGVLTNVTDVFFFDCRFMIQMCKWFFGK